MTISDTIDAIDAEFGSVPDWEDRYALIIGMGKQLAPYPEEFRTEDFKVKGCQSQVWLHPVIDGGVVRFDADSDALIVKGLVALLVRIFSGHTPKEILDAPTDFIVRLGLDRHLSQNRANGLAGMLKQVKLYALAYSMVKPS